jgi:hypothetical protein
MITKPADLLEYLFDLDNSTDSGGETPHSLGSTLWPSARRATRDHDGVLGISSCDHIATGRRTWQMARCPLGTGLTTVPLGTSIRKAAGSTRKLLTLTT